MSPEAIAIAGGGVALLAVLVPLIRTLHGRVIAELAELRRDLHALAARSLPASRLRYWPLAPDQRLACSGAQGRLPGDRRRVTCRCR